MNAHHPSALDVAAPSAAVDRLAPWLGPGPVGERALFWVSFHGLSTFTHVLVLGLVALPLLAPRCGPVDVVDKAPVTVQMAIVEVKPPPAPEPPAEPVVDNPPPAKTKKADRSRPPKEPNEREVRMLGVLGTSRGGAFGGVLSTSDEIDGALSGIIGTVDDAEGGAEGGGFGFAGLGHRGEGLGLGTIGTGGASRRSVSMSLDGAPAEVVRNLERMLASCRPSEPVRGTVVVKGERVVDVALGPAGPAESCMTSRLRRTLGLADGTYPITITPR